MNFQKAAVIGAGAMGSGIAQSLSQAGLQVFLKDVNETFVQKGLASIKKMYESRVKKEILSQANADHFFSNIHASSDDHGLNEVDLVIEAALEKIDIKLDIFRKLDKICPPHTILASNTSALSISEIATATKRSGKVVGMHFFNPAQTMRLVEVIPGVRTQEETIGAILDFCRQLGKIPVRVNECPGFFVNRVLFPYINEALHVLQEGQFSAHQIDTAAMQFGLPMGPFTLLDMTGLDVCAHVNTFLQSEYGERFKTAPVLPKLVQQGFLGQKSGAGIYIHNGSPPARNEKRLLNPAFETILKELCLGERPVSVPNSASSETFDIYRIVLPMFNEAIYALQEQVISANDIDIAMKNGTGLRRGLLSTAEDKGLAWCHNQLQAYCLTKGERFRPSWYLSKLVRAGLHDFRELTSDLIPVQ